MKLAGLGAFAALKLPAAARLPDATMDATKATLTKETFGDLRIFLTRPGRVARWTI